MTNLRDLQLLAALARHRHFARAAEDCGISQPAFSGRIRNLEAELGTPLVQRGNRYMGLTAEGEVVLRWAHRLLADAEGLRQDIAALKGGLTGRLALGTVPTALGFAAGLPDRVHARHPGLTMQILSATSAEILRGLEDFSFDAGLTYLDGLDGTLLRAEFVYAERYVLLCPPALAPRTQGTARWAEAAGLPLCLLVRSMQNRRILDEVFLRAGTQPRPVSETKVLTAALLQAAAGQVATIVPERLAEGIGPAIGLIALPLVDPVVETPVGLVMLDRDPDPPSLKILAAEVRRLAAGLQQA